MDFFLILFFALLVFVTIGLLVVFYYVRKGIRFFRRMSNGTMTEEEFERLANRHYRGKNDGEAFDEDYFKGHAWQRDGRRQQRPSQQARTTRTADGVTIVDRRKPDDISKKIFSKDEGEYVDFTE